MSAIDNGATAPYSSEDGAQMISDTESGSSVIGSGAPDTPACPYQTAEFFGQECSRYHDCPTHMIERNSVDEATAETRPIETSSRHNLQEVTLPQANGTVEDAATAEGSGAEANQAGASIPEQTQATDTPPLSVFVNNSSPEQTNSALQSGSQREQASVAQEEGITLREALRQTTESLNGLSLENSIPSSSIPEPRPPHPRNASQNGTAPSVPPENQQSTSRLNPIAPAFSPRPERRSPQEIALPRWQPDSEVTYCPICHTQFSFFVRKHHCRKCGRVVCNACSPHKITIPHQYIVRPPGERSFHRYSFLGDEGSIADFSTLGGGEQVRLCNPCVPDPNTTPPQTQHSTSQFSPRSPHQRSQSSSSGNFNADSNTNRYSPYLMSPNVPPDAYPRSRSVTMHSGPGPSRSTNSNYLPPQIRIMSGTPPAYYPHPYSTHRHPSSLLGHRFPGSSLIDLAGPSSSSSSAAMNRPLPPPPQIPEEDECPICHRELPSRELPNFEACRESHIESCIIAHSTYSPSRDVSGRSGNHGTPPPRATRRTGMFPYLATEKDCVDSAECTICLEEFEVGVPMARLECLCRFHRSCITAWFVDHPGRCPVHQHDSFGY
ncbi:FYVE-domain-containing protein [Hypoxylon sp. FL0543]|nr:FYVE-domain-containing protein [Hypoxylon sp. FL0543]